MLYCYTMWICCTGPKPAERPHVVLLHHVNMLYRTKACWSSSCCIVTPCEYAVQDQSLLNVLMLYCYTMWICCTGPKPADRPHKKKKNLPAADPAKTSLILFDEVNVNALILMWKKLIEFVWTNLFLNSVRFTMVLGLWCLKFWTFEELQRMSTDPLWALSSDRLLLVYCICTL